jgi:hypothetical protein
MWKNIQLVRNRLSACLRTSKRLLPTTSQSPCWTGPFVRIVGIALPSSTRLESQSQQLPVTYRQKILGIALRSTRMGSLS